MADILWAAAQGAMSIIVPVFPGEPIHFGPVPAQEVVVSVLVMTGICFGAGYYLTRTTVLLRMLGHWRPQLRDEAWVEEIDCKGSGSNRKRTAGELLFIAVHNSVVSLLAILAWLLRMPSLALHAFMLEVGYEIFDTFSLGPQRLEPETLIHHIVSPICIICSTQTDIDFRVLCHLCVCIDFSGAILGYCKFLLRYAHVSSTLVYHRLSWVYAVLRVALPLVDSVIIVRNRIVARGGLFRWSEIPTNGEFAHFGQTDWTQLYFWAMAVLNAFNAYFWLVIRSRARMPQHILAQFEVGGCR